MKNRLFLICSVFSLLLCFAGCNNNVTYTPDGKTSPEEKIYYVSGSAAFDSANALPSVLSDVETSTSRIAVPVYDSDNVYYKIEAVLSDDSQQKIITYSDTSDFKIGLKSGEWELRAYCYLKTASGYTGDESDLIFTSAGSVTVNTSDSESLQTSHKLPLKIYITDTPQFNVSLPISVESTSVANKAVITWETGKSKELEFSGDALEQNFIASSSNMSLGTVSITITFYKGSDVVYVCNETIITANILTTNKWLPNSSICINSDGKFILTANHILYKDMTDFYVDSSATGSKNLGTPYNPFTSIDKAYTVLTTVPFETFNIHVKASSDLQTSKTYNLDATNTPSLKTFSISTYGKNDLNNNAKITAGSGLTQFLTINKENLTVSITNMELDGTNITRITGYNCSLINLVKGELNIENCSIETGKGASSYTHGIIANSKLSLSNTSIKLNSSGNSYAAICIEKVGSSESMLEVTLDNVVLEQGESGAGKNSGIYIVNNEKVSLEIDGASTKISGFAYGIHFRGSSNYNGTDSLYKIKNGSITNNDTGIYVSGSTGSDKGNVPLEISGGTIEVNGGNYLIDFRNATVGTTIKIGGNAVMKGKVYLSATTIISTTKKLEEDNNISLVCKYVNGTQVLDKNEYLADNLSKFSVADGEHLIDADGKLTQTIVYYIDETVSSDKNNGVTPETAFSTVDKALAVVNNTHINYIFKICSNIHKSNGKTTAPIFMTSAPASSITFESDDENVKRIVYANTSANENELSSNGCIYINLGTTRTDFIFNNLQFKGSKITSNTSGVIYFSGNSSYKSTMTFKNCIIGDETATDLPDSNTCANMGNVIYSTFKNIVLNNTIICKNYGSAIYCLGKVTVENGSQIKFNSSSTENSSVISVNANGDCEITVDNSSITNNYAYNGSALSCKSSTNMMILTLDGKVTIKDNKSGASSPEEKYTNVYLSSNDYIVLNETFDSASDVGITVKEFSDSERTITSGYNTYHSSLDPSSVFHSDNSSYEITWNGTSTEAVIREKQTPINATGIVVKEHITTGTGSTTGYSETLVDVSSDTAVREFNPVVYSVNPFDIDLTYLSADVSSVSVKAYYDAKEVTVGLSSSSSTQDGTSKTYYYKNISCTKDYSGTVKNLSSVKIFFNGHSSPDYTIIPKEPSIYYVTGTDGKLSPPDGIQKCGGSSASPFDNMLSAFQMLYNKKGTIYVDGTVTCTPAEGSSSKTGIEFSGDDTNITVLGYAEGGASGGKLITDSGNRVMAIWSGKVTLGEKLTISGGSCTETTGGGIFNAAELVLDGCTITGNTVTGSESMGGGVYGNQTSTTTIKRDTIISNNTSKFGGGITVCGGTLTLEDGTFSGNSASGAGKDIQLKVYEKDDGGTPVRIDPVFKMCGNTTGTINILLGYDDQNDEPAGISLFATPSIYYNLELDSKIGVGNQLIVKDDGMDSAVFSKFKILKDGMESSTLYIDSDGRLASRGQNTGITIGDLGRTSIPVVDVNTFNTIVIQKSSGSSEKNKISIPLSDEVYNHLASVLICVMYDSEGNIVNKDGDKTSRSASVSGTSSSYSGAYYIDQFDSFPIGIYKLQISANSKTAGVDLETVTVTVKVVY